MNKMILGKTMREINIIFYVELLGLNHMFHVGLPLVRRNQHVELSHVTHRKKVSFTTRFLPTKSFSSQLLIGTVFKLDHLERKRS